MDSFFIQIECGTKVEIVSRKMDHCVGILKLEAGRGMLEVTISR